MFDAMVSSLLTVVVLVCLPSIPEALSGCDAYFTETGWTADHAAWTPPGAPDVRLPDVDVFAVGNSSCASTAASEAVDAVDTARCGIDRVDRLTAAEFVHSYQHRRPVIIRNMTNNCAFRDQCTRHRLLDEFGSSGVILSTANAHSYDKFRVSLHQYISDMMHPQDVHKDGASTLYHFGDHDPADWSDLLSQYVRPPYPDTETAALSWGLAGHATGVPFHTHGAVFAEVLHGKKRWFLYPPKKGFRPEYNPNDSTLRWLLDVYPSLSEEHRPVECVCEPGEILYVPAQWWHATLNIGQSVFISAFL